MPQAAALQPAHPQSTVQSKQIFLQSEGDSVAAYLAMPVESRAAAGETRVGDAAIIVVHSRWGLDKWTKRRCDSLAAAGFTALAPDLYRSEVTEDFMTAHELERAVPQNRVRQDLVAAALYLRSNGAKKTGIVGWSMGGTFALRMASETKAIDACATNYGALITTEAALKNITVPVLGNYAAQDFGIDSADVATFRNTLKTLGKTADVKIYPNLAHAFASPESEAYSDREAKDAWQRTIFFFRRYLRP
ncbi:MAG: dienelactone hydrolase family protein [Rhizobacter sp.]|nr:dienelactone hydrolase family protein [Chlorobiales bacterium]